MQVKITQKGAFDRDGKERKVGEIVAVEGDKIPASLVNKCVRVANKDGRTMVVNPAQVPDRGELFKAAVAQLTADDFNDNGTPDVRAINDQLEEGVPPFTAAERNEIWAEINS